MKLHNLIVIILVFILNINVFGQVSKLPDRVTNTHYTLSDYYENALTNRTQLSKDSITRATKYLEQFYDSVTEYYRYFKTKKKVLKGVRVYADNDAFTFFDNRDHEYTGGMRIEFITDYVGLKLLSFRREHRFLTYQAVFFGFELYTPDVLDIRDVGDLNPNDRPFASFQYIGRSRNILKYDGSYRSTGELKFGVIGGEVSRNFQRIIHRDITDSSNNNGWDFQIANGGRLAIQYDNSHEWQFKMQKKNIYFHYGFQYGVGWAKNYLGPMFTVTNKSFFERNPHNAINSTNRYFGSQKWWDQVKQTAFFAIQLKPEFVFYNSMLQGYPTTNEDFVFDGNRRVTIPVIKDIYPVVGKFSLSVGFRNYNSNLLFEYYFQTPEYDYAFKNKFLHKYARISFTMNI